MFTSEKNFAIRPASQPVHQFQESVLAVFYCYGQLINFNSQGLSIIVWCLSKHRIISTAFGAAEVLGLIIAAPPQSTKKIYAGAPLLACLLQ
jgi:hypothetical protein